MDTTDNNNNKNNYNNNKDLSNEKNYHPITCLNTSYKILKDIVAKYMREHTVVNEI